jgi:hypothetical protein
MPRAALLISFALFLAASVSSASAPPGRYLVSGGSVYDTKTRLTWEQSPSTSTFMWGAATSSGTAQNHCASLDGGAWRVPTVAELVSIVDFGAKPHADATAFPGTESAPYWTSTALPSGALAWLVDFSNAAINNDPPTVAHYVRCVR